MTKPVSIASVVLVLTIGLTLTVSLEQDCPVKCRCKQISTASINRQVVDCTDFEERDLIHFKNLSVDTTDLILRDGSWNTIDFANISSHLTKLITISINNFTTDHLSRYSDSIQKRKFEAIQNISIQLTRISSIRKGMFDYFPKITHIILDHNQIDETYKDSFHGLNNIEFINLSHNCIEKIEENTFTSIKIKTLDLSNNKLKEKDICLLKKTLSSTIVLPVEECPLILYGIGSYMGIFAFLICISAAFVFFSFYFDFGFFYSYFNKNKNKDPSKTVGKIKYYPQQKLGRNVFKGEITYDEDNVESNRKVAVKRSKINNRSISKELEILVQLTSKGEAHNNVIQYIIAEKDKKYRYIALAPLCEETLYDAILNNNERAIKYMTTGRGSCLEQLANGLEVLDDHKVQHRDIKPENILIKYNGDTARFIISDFDLGHITGKISRNRIKYGTRGWVAPELWGKEARSSAVDVFSMGCVFYYVLAKGCHPFGEIDNLKECQKNICNDKEPPPQLSQLTIEGSREFKPVLAKGLINSMIERDYKLRPKIKLITQHPMFWNSDEITKFYQYINIGKKIVTEKQETFQNMLRASSSEVYTGNWTSCLEVIVQSDVDKKFKKDDICKLLRHIRNTIEHFDELSEKLKEMYYDSSEGVARYFNEQFPKLLLYTFQKKEKLEQL